MFGHEFERENVKHFVEAGREGLFSRKASKESILLFLILASLPLIGGISDEVEEKEPRPGIISVMVVVIYIFHLIWTGKKGETYASRLVSTGLGQTSFSLSFLNLAVVNSITQKDNGVHLGLVISIYILFFVIIFGGTLYGIKKDWYRPIIPKLKRAKQMKKALSATVVGVTAGGLIFKRFIDNLGPKEEERFLACFALMTSIIMLLGIVNFLKAYYVKKYGFTDPYEDGWYKPKRRKLKEAENEESTK